MKYFLVLLLLLSACSKKTVDQLVETINKETSNIQNEESLGKGPFELFLGIHQIEYFADRMVLKSKLSGYDFAKKTTFQKDGVTHYQVILGPFKSQSEAMAAEKEIKSRAPDLNISKIRAVK